MRSGIESYQVWELTHNNYNAETLRVKYLQIFYYGRVTGHDIITRDRNLNSIRTVRT
jgi:hypothetical protein